ncbi:MAG: alpha/beta hydrolase [Rhodospirillales bacterium]|nr:alpha/beta hydrolase [Rhodospirillales bacterium]
MARKIRIPTTISAEATAYLGRDPGSASWPTTPDEWKEMRTTLRNGFNAASQSVHDAFVERIDVETINGVRVERVVPKSRSRAADSKAVMYLFGGGYISGSPWEGITLSAPLAHSLGIDVWAVDYPLAPENPYPAALDASLVVYKHLCETYGADNVGVSGDSAGGNLTLATVLRAMADGLPPPAVLALFSPWSDLTDGGDTMRTLEGIDPDLDFDSYLGKSAAAYAGERDTSDPEISPLYAAYPEGFPPTIISTGTRDLLLSDCARLHLTLKRAGVPASLNVWEGMWHDFEFYPEIPEGQESLAEMAGFLAAYLEIDV